MRPNTPGNGRPPHSHPELDASVQSSLLNSILESHTDHPIVALDNDGRILAWNEGAHLVYGYETAEVVGESVFALHDPADVASGKIQDILDRVRRAGTWSGVVTRVRKSGDAFNAHVTITARRDADGRQSGFTMICRDVTDTGRIERELRESRAFNEQLSVAVEQSPAAVLITDVEGRIEYVNRRFSDVTGYPLEEVLGKTPAILQSGLTPASTYEDLWTTIRAGGEWRGEFQNRRKNGELFWNSVSISPIRDSAGAISKFIAVQMDVTRQKMDLDALCESEERFRQLAENMKEVFFVANSGDLSALYVSPAYESIWGRSLRSLHESPRSFLEPVPVEDQERLAVNIARIQQGEDPGEIEFRVVRPDGQMRWLLAHAVPIRNPQGEVYRISGVALDITERKAAENALRESERRLRSLFETVNLIVLELDAEGRVAYANPFLLRLTGYSRDEVIGASWFDRFLPLGSRKQMWEVFSELKESALHPHFKNTVVTHDGEERLISWHNTVLRDGEGRPTGTLSIGEDITEHARLEAQFRQAQKMEAVGRLAGGVAHDFNNLLTAILGYSQLSLMGLRPEDPLTRNIQEITKASERAAALTRQLLAFSRQQVLAPRVLDLNELVVGIEKMLHRLLGEDIELSASLARELGRVKADPGQLEQVIVNLAVNARDAMPDGGKLTITTVNATTEEVRSRELVTVPPGRYVMLAIGDTGHGMSEKTQARIFEPFFTTKEAGKGTGLGLSTVYGIVKQSGGFIWVQSQYDLGTTFKIFLPCADEAAEPQRAAPAPSESATGMETILLVEDEPAVRGLAQMALTRAGYRVLSAANGGEALLQCERHPAPIHLILTDVVMPEMGGPELVRRLTPLRPEMKILYMSGYIDRASERRAMVKPQSDFLEKPFSPDVLLRRVRDALDAPIATEGS
jgi:two-component system, cell cycle sensor histidine kinase and response regulator CckA